MTKIILPLFIALLPMASNAQTAQPIEIGQDGKTSYAIDYFARFTPENALDIVYNIPGFSIEEGESARGLAGTSGNILINGSRPGTKGTDIEDILKNILLKDIIKIEVLEGASLEGQGQGYNKLVNIVKKETTSSSSSIELQTSFSVVKPVLPFISFENNQNFLGFNTRFTLKTGTEFVFKRLGHEYIKNAQGNLIEQGNNLFRPILSFDLIGFNSEGKIGNIKTNLNYSFYKEKLKRKWLYDARNPIDNSFLRFDEGIDNFKESGHELSIILESNILKFKNETSLYANFEKDDDNSIAGFNSNILDKSFEIFEENGDSVETVIQTNFSKNYGNHTISFGGETGINSLDIYSVSRIFSKKIVTTNPNDIYKTNIEETRSEIFVSDNWKISDKLSFETRLRNEWSKITQTGDANKSRDFKYFKPSFNLNYNPVKNLNFILGYEHKLGQLNFGDFAFSKNLNDNNQSQSTTDLRPDQIDIIKFIIEKKWGKEGNLRLELINNDYTDAVINLPVFENGIITGETIGNIPEAKSFEANIEGFIPLDKIYNGLKLSISYFYTKEELLDPITNLKREFDYEDRTLYMYELIYNKDNSDFNYSIDYKRGKAGKSFRLNNSFDFTPVDEFGINAEYKGFKSLKINARIYNPFGAELNRYRTTYKDGTRNSEIIEMQYRKRNLAPGMNLTIRKTI